MFVKTYKFFNQSTRQALLEKIRGYVDKSKSAEKEILLLKDKYNLDKIYRFDLGVNVDGFSPKVLAFLENLYRNKVLFSKINEYPDVTHINLRKRIAGIFDIKREQIVVSSGLDSILDLITRVFYDYNDMYLMPVPGFYLFESYSERMGAIPIFLRLKEENNFKLTKHTFSDYNSQIIKFRPKIVWISNPNNPTGQVIPDSILEELIKLASSYNAFIVVDEAYMEYIGGAESSAIKFINTYENLMVLRTFSKAYGLAGIRLGYLVCASEDIIDAMLLHRHHFPITQISINIAGIALKDTGFLEQTRINTKRRRDLLMKDLDKLKTFKYIPSTTNIFMLKNEYLTSKELDLEFKKQGIIASTLNITGIERNRYMRITIRSVNENKYFAQVCSKIDRQVIKRIGMQ